MAILSVRELIDYAYQAGYRGLELIAIVAIALAESSGNTTAINNTAYPDRPNYRPPKPGAVPEYSVGPLQINIGPGAHNYTEAQLTDPVQAFGIAYSDFGSSFSQWSTYASGASAAYLAEVGAAVRDYLGQSTQPIDSQPFTPTAAPTLEQRFGVNESAVLASSIQHGTVDRQTGSDILPVDFPKPNINPLDIPIVGDIPGALREIFGNLTVPFVSTGSAIVDLLVWLRKPEHWWRLFFIGAGGALMIVGMGIYLRPDVELGGGPVPLKAKVAA